MLLSILGPQTMTILVKRLQWNKVFILYEKATGNMFRRCSECLSLNNECRLIVNGSSHCNNNNNNLCLDSFS
jgi:hypothetical protein